MYKARELPRGAGRGDFGQADNEVYSDCSHRLGVSANSFIVTERELLVDLVDIVDRTVLYIGLHPVCLLINLKVAEVVKHAFDAKVMLLIVCNFEDLFYLGVGNAKALYKV